MNHLLQSSILAAALLLSSCGAEPGAQSTSDGSPKLSGDLMLATQCPYGVVGPAQPGRFKLQGCAGVLSDLELLPTSTLYFAGDCTQKTLAVRTGDLALDTLWQVLPDNNFSLWVGNLGSGLRFKMKDGSQCWSPGDLHIFGRLDCQDQDRMAIRFDEIRLELAVDAPPPSDTSARGLPRCNLPASCRMEASPSLYQCR